MADLSAVVPHDATETPSESACGRLIRRAFTPNELSSLIEAILSSKEEDTTIRNLSLEDAQKFVDAIDEALNTPDLSPSTQKKSLRLLYRTCGHHAIVPSTLKVPVDYDRTGDALYRGGYADVWKGECSGQDVAVKVIRLYSKDVLQKVINKFCKEAVTWKSLQHPNILPLIGVMMSETRFAMVSVWMANGNINEFIKAHPNADRLGLLVDAAEGLIYLHGNGMIHGDIKGLNILIDETHHARLADFGLLTIMSDPAHLISSSSHGQGGTIRWMGPELIAPEKFGLKKSRLTKSSDCYALSMVIYETISGNAPFYECIETAVYVKVLLGEHPSRGAAFSEDLWKMMESCWTFQPDDRPSIADVLRCLRADSNIPEPTPQPCGMVEMRRESQAPSDDGLPTIRIGTSPTITAGRNTHIPRVMYVADNGPAFFPALGAYIHEGVSPSYSISSVDPDERGADPWMPHPSWKMPADHNPHKRMPKEPDPSYFSVELSENPLGLENMHISRESRPQEKPFTTPWRWVPEDLPPSSGDEDEGDDESTPPNGHRDDPSPTRLHHIDYSSHRSRTPLSFQMHPLFAYSRLHHAPIQYDVSRTPSALTVMDCTTHSPVPAHTLAQPATDPPIAAPDQLVLRSHKFPWVIFVKAGLPYPPNKKSKHSDPRSPATGTYITNLDVLYAIHTTLIAQVTPEEWEALGDGSKAQQRVARAYRRRCAPPVGGGENGVRRVDWLGSKTHLVGIEANASIGGIFGWKLVFSRIL